MTVVSLIFVVWLLAKGRFDNYAALIKPKDPTEEKDQ